MSEAAARPNALVETLVAEGVMWITLANPPANAFSMAMMEALQTALDDARDDPAVRVVVIGAGGKVLSAGHNLKEMQAHRADPDGGRAFFEQTFETCGRLMQSVVQLPKPVIAAVDGIATAAGCQLVASCDLAVASERATFGVNGIDVGLFCSTPAVALSRKVHRKHAMEMLLTGGMIDAATAREYGLVNRVVPPEYLGQAVERYARTIAAKPPAAVALGKASFYAQVEQGLADAYAGAAEVMVENMMDEAAEEGISAFVEKRKPGWASS